EASVIDFDMLVAKATNRSDLERPIWSDDVFDRAQLFQRTLGRLDHTKSRAIIEEWLGSATPEKYIAALEAIEAAPNSEWKSAMVERALSIPQETVRSNAISIICDLEYTAAFETLARKAL